MATAAERLISKLNAAWNGPEVHQHDVYERVGWYAAEFEGNAFSELNRRERSEAIYGGVGPFDNEDAVMQWVTDQLDEFADDEVGISEMYDEIVAYYRDDS